MELDGPPSSALVANAVAPILRCGDDCSVERMSEGVSTWVYRVERPLDVLYVRVWPEEGDSFAPEALAHRLLRARGVLVPEVVHWEHRHSLLGRSIMITTAISGRAIAVDGDISSLRDVLRAAGRDLALANGIVIDGWGWVVRDTSEPPRLAGEYADARSWLDADWEEHLRALRDHAVFESGDIATIAAVVRKREGMCDGERAMLAHGDWDVSHIFVHDGVYSGIIDWGEIRGAQPFYDLGHFAIENAPLLPYVLEGYTEVVHLPPDIAERNAVTGLRIAIERIGGGLRRRPPRPPYPPYVAAVRRAIAALA